MTNQSPTRLTVQTGWTWDAEFIGYFVAFDEGDYRSAGLEVEFLEGGHDADPEEAVLSGKADIAISIPESTFRANAAGADLVFLGSQYRRNPLAVISPVGAPLTTPADLAGTVICVPETSRTTFRNLIAVAGIDPERVEVRDLDEFAAPLADGSVDGVVGFSTSMIEDLAREGVATTHFHFDDFVGATLQNTIIARRPFAARNAPAISRWLRASAIGWMKNFENADRYPRSMRSTWFRKNARSIEGEILHNHAQRQFMDDGPDMFSLGRKQVEALERVSSIAHQFILEPDNFQDSVVGTSRPWRPDIPSHHHNQLHT